MREKKEQVGREEQREKGERERKKRERERKKGERERKNGERERERNGKKGISHLVYCKSIHHFIKNLGIE